jgi:hypothetical protein
LAFVLSVLLRFTDSDYPFGNSSLFIPVISYFCCRVHDKYFMLVSLCPTLFLGINDVLHCVKTPES